ncbi:uncharacterized protein PV09_09109 [Verruconis gallopava]|uniref:Uncharacterized protein n=1 Tax=Verruconis gallopava TaxID=253628 RepID=A0A0D2AJP2_9PEZI|nr:uncharacterized protein PV09_09109 [Verruconis gallopava]KIV99153.1 hypothetical protein PV09_09109 [Verruconis gallopava]
MRDGRRFKEDFDVPFVSPQFEKVAAHLGEVNRVGTSVDAEQTYGPFRFVVAVLDRRERIDQFNKTPCVESVGSVLSVSVSAFEAKSARFSSRYVAIEKSAPA